MTRVTLKLQGLTYDKCVRRMTEDLGELEGTSQVEVTRDGNKSGTTVATDANILADEVLIETVKGTGDHTVEVTERQQPK